MKPCRRTTGGPLPHSRTPTRTPSTSSVCATQAPVLHAASVILGMMTEYPQSDPGYLHWQRQASGWERCAERMSPVHRPITDWLVDALDPQPGQTLLELAAGPGDAGFAAARRLEGGRVLQTDRAPAMVDAARRRGEALGLRNVEWAVMDAQALPLADGSVDGVLCRFGYMLMDTAAALGETRRVLRRGGRLAFAVWDSA